MSDNDWETESREIYSEGDLSVSVETFVADTEGEGPLWFSIKIGDAETTIGNLGGDELIAAITLARVAHAARAWD